MAFSSLRNTIVLVTAASAAVIRDTTPVRDTGIELFKRQNQFPTQDWPNWKTGAQTVEEFCMPSFATREEAAHIWWSSGYVYHIPP